MPNQRLVLDNPVLRIDKGRIAPPSEDDPEPRGSYDEHIPWGYGHDRLTAMAVDPNRLYLYWELTDPSLEKARQALGNGAKDSWVNLRIYDVTNRIFDGTNAHSYFDIKVDRSDRQWFVHVGKPASTHVAEIGLKSLEGYFVKVVRSGRVDFPRFEPSPDGTVEWLTVRTATGPVDSASPGAPPGGPPPRGGHAGGHGAGGGGGGDGNLAMHHDHRNGVPIVELSEWSWTGWEELFQTTWQELFRTRWRDGRPTIDWATPLVRTTWEAGPLPVPVEVPRVTEEFHQGPMTIMPAEGGKTRGIYGPWEVVVRGIGGHAEKRIIAKWEMSASWVVEMGVERVVSKLSPEMDRRGREKALENGAFFAPGSSELLGASERHWLSASDIRLRGGSELYFAGASELRRRGASEIMMGSERRLLGASERLGGSERVWRGASEQRLGGSSDVAFPFDDAMKFDPRA